MFCFVLFLREKHAEEAAAGPSLGLGLPQKLSQVPIHSSIETPALVGSGMAMGAVVLQGHPIPHLLHLG